MKKLLLAGAAALTIAGAGAVATSQQKAPKPVKLATDTTVVATQPTTPVVQPTAQAADTQTQTVTPVDPAPTGPVTLFQTSAASAQFTPTVAKWHVYYTATCTSMITVTLEQNGGYKGSSSEGGANWQLDGSGGQVGDFVAGGTLDPVGIVVKSHDPACTWQITVKTP